MKERLYIVIPAYNEEMNIEMVAREWHEVIANIGEGKLIIVDDGSKDNTYAKLQELQNELSYLIALTKPNGGHGSAVLFAYEYALTESADYVFQTDSDGQTAPDEFWELWKTRADYDIQIGYRKDRQDGLSRIVVTKLLKLVLFFYFGLWIKDANTPFRLMSAVSLSNFLPRIPKNHNLANVLLTVLYEKNKARRRYVSITFRPRQGGINSINIPRIVRIGLKAMKDFAGLKKSL
ncbi:MAG: glycosyltransferase family 2 protein [Treponema sp.]|jgi:glycosyltransferase involved in cell wall biosynthesis|nr:glycosyltransferase family 2 protein [Treponema sp.]